MQNKEKKKIGLTTLIFIALIAGAILGVVLHYGIVENTKLLSVVNKSAKYDKRNDHVLRMIYKFFNDFVINGVFLVVGQGFIRGMKMLVVPLVFTSLVCGASSMGDTKTLGKVGVKTMGFYIMTTMMAVAVALTTASIINPGKNLNMSAIKADATVKTAKGGVNVAETLLNIIPENPVSALANGEMLQIIFFALLIGIILAKLSDKVQIVTNFFTQFNDIMMELTMMVMAVAPVGVFCLISKTFSQLGFSAMLPMVKYMAAVFIALGIQCLGVYQGLLFVFTRLNPFKFIKKFFPVQAFAFSTATSNATIPLNIDTLEEKMGVSRKISSFTIPLGATINMDGTSIMQGVAVIFVAQAYHVNLTLVDLITVIFTATLASVGTAGIPSVGLVTLTMVFNSVGLPVEGIALIMGIDRILDMTRTAVNITGDAVCTTIVAKQCGELNQEVFNRME